MTKWVWILAALFMACPGAAGAAYRLGPGDVVEMSVFGAPDFKRRMTVNVDGEVSVPLIGEVPASGLGLGDLRRRLVQSLVASQAFLKPDVTLEIVEYRPFFIAGDVARPGAIPYRPGLTVRHAVALAGGYDALRFKAENPLLAAPEYRSQYESLWTDLVRRQARALSLRAEIAGKPDFDRATLRAAPLAPAAVEEIADLETRDLELRRDATERDRSSTKDRIARLDVELASLETSLGEQRDALVEQTAAATRLANGEARGFVAASRVDETRRGLASLRGLSGDVDARLAQARRDRDEAARHLAAIPDEARARLVHDLEDAVVESGKLRAQIQGAGEKLVYVGALNAQLRAGGGNGPSLLLHRRVDGKTQSLAAAEDTEVLPDDVLDVVVRPDQLVVAPAR